MSFKSGNILDILKFPYSISILKNFSRNLRILQKLDKIKKNESSKKLIAQNFEAMKIIMARNLEWRIKLFKDENVSKLLKEIIQEYVRVSQKENFKAIFVFLPQKDDIIFIKNNYHFEALMELITWNRRLRKEELIDAENYSNHDSALESDDLNVKNITGDNSLSYPNLLSEKDNGTGAGEVETRPLIPEWANQTDNPAFFQNLDIPTFLRRRGSSRPRQ